MVKGAIYLSAQKVLVLILDSDHWITNSELPYVEDYKRDWEATTANAVIEDHLCVYINTQLQNDIYK